jgi:hypothetical protein
VQDALVDNGRNCLALQLVLVGPALLRVRFVPVDRVVLVDHFGLVNRYRRLCRLDRQVLMVPVIPVGRVDLVGLVVIVHLV